MEPDATVLEDVPSPPGKHVLMATYWVDDGVPEHVASVLELKKLILTYGKSLHEYMRVPLTPRHFPSAQSRTGVPVHMELLKILYVLAAQSTLVLKSPIMLWQMPSGAAAGSVLYPCTVPEQVVPRAYEDSGCVCSVGG